jgi:peptide/nickel transport system permease protein
MQRYIIRRLLLMIPTLLGVTLLVFALVRFVPGDIVQTVVGENAIVTPETRARIEERLGLDRPWYEQYGQWLFDAMRGDLGNSLSASGRSITGEIQGRLPVTLELTFFALLIGLLIAVPIGVISAIRQDTWLDYIARSLGIAGIAVPIFWIATLVIVLPSVWWKRRTSR